MITSSIPPSVGEKLIGLVTSREEIPELLKVHFIYQMEVYMRCEFGSDLFLPSAPA